MNSDKRMDPSGAPDSVPAAPSSASRRRLLQAGLGASPVVLTFVSRPVVAGGTCQSASASISAGSPGRRGVVVTQCAGLGPVAWTTTSDTAKADSFSTIGSYSMKSGTFTLSSPSIAQVLASTGTAPGDVLARSMAAAYLNLKSGRVPSTIVTQNLLVTMWSAVTTGSLYYTPIAGNSTHWYAADICTWLAKTWQGSN